MTDVPQFKTLADWRRWLQKPGATVQVVRHMGLLRIAPNDPEAAAKRDRFLAPRRINKVTPTYVIFDGGSRLELAPASRFRFDPGFVTVDLTDAAKAGPFDRVMVYKCWIADQQVQQEATP